MCSISMPYLLIKTPSPLWDQEILTYIRKCLGSVPAWAVVYKCPVCVDLLLVGRRSERLCRRLVIFKIPNVITKFCRVFLSTVLERVFMIVESGFKCVGGKADIGLVRFVVISVYCSLIYNRLREALAEEWAFLAFSAVAFVSFWLIEFHKDGLVVTVNGFVWCWAYRRSWFWLYSCWILCEAHGSYGILRLRSGGKFCRYW